MPAPRFVLDEFWPSDLFLGGVPGAWYDPTDLSTMFQDSAGTTPVTAVEQPVGLILDKSQGLALGAELVTNGTFPVNLNGWTIGDGTPTWVAPGAMRLDSTSARQSAYQDVPTVIGATYEIRATLSNFSAGGFAPRLSVWSGAFVSLLGSIGLSAGNFVGRFRATATTIRLQAYADLGGIANFDDISVRELAGNHASQSTAASRPTYRARYNLLTQSEDFSQAVWIKFGGGTGVAPVVTTNAATAPDGTLTADSIVFNRGAGNLIADQSTMYQAPTVVGGSHTQTIWLKAATPADVGKQLGLRNVAGGSYLAVTLTADWVRYSRVETGSASNFEITNRGTVSTGNTVTALVWGAQLLTAADVTATGNAYQRIAAATVYDTAPVFRPYLAFDGMDDSLSTTAINFTATDKMSVFSGVTKNTDGSAGCVAELSATAITNDGSFALFSSAGGAVWYVAGRGTALGSFACATFTAPITNTVSSMIDIAQPALASELIPRINTTINQTGASGTDIGTGNFGNWPLFIGRRNNASLPFNGRLYSLIVRGAASSVTEIADTELWVNARTGAF
jgi:hypothetical protein